MREFGVKQQVAVLPMSLFWFGVMFAPVWTPHASEILGRRPVYLIFFPIFALFILGASRSKTIGALLVCRFFAGLFGGPMVVLIEGTFADVWSASYTVTYYSFLAVSPLLMDQEWPHRPPWPVRRT